MGTCSGTPTAGCSGLGYYSCTQVPGCSPNYPPGGDCQTAPGGNVNSHTYGWYCRGPDGEPDYCNQYTSSSSGVIYYPTKNSSACASYPCTVGGVTAYGCQWTGPECGGSASSCSGIESSNLCASLGCTWTVTTNGPATPTVTLTPNPAYNDSVLAATAYAVDPAGNTVRYYYEWSIEGSTLKADGNPVGSTGTPQLASSFNCSYYPECTGGKNVTVKATAWSSSGATEPFCSGAGVFDCYSYLEMGTTSGGYSYPNGCSSSAPSPFCQTSSLGCDGLNADGTPCHDACGICPSGVDTYSCEGSFICDDLTDRPACQSAGCTWHTGASSGQTYSASASKTQEITSLFTNQPPAVSITSVTPNPATPSETISAQVQSTDPENGQVSMTVQFKNEYGTVLKSVSCPAAQSPYLCSLATYACTSSTCVPGRNISVWAQASDGTLQSAWANTYVGIVPEPTAAPSGDLSSLIPLAIAVVLSGYAIAYMAAQMFNL
ncbi:MAG: hypothetical protein WC506_02640 [Candidatus Micrarchaeia archaeon]